MAVYVCGVCGYEYDEEQEGVAFNELPEDWVCPVCGVDKTNFTIKE
jgi:rubredoxin